MASPDSRASLARASSATRNRWKTKGAMARSRVSAAASSRSSKSSQPPWEACGCSARGPCACQGVPARPPFQCVRRCPPCPRQHPPGRLQAQTLLLKVPDSKPVQQVLFAVQQLEELQVCVWPRDNDGRAAPAKYVLSLLRGGGEKPQAPGAALMVATSLSLLQVTPSDKRAAKPLRFTRRVSTARPHVLQATWGGRHVLEVFLDAPASISSS